jgi:hypothetical protein
MRIPLLALALLASEPALGQSAFITPSGAYANGSVEMCNNGSNQFVPCTTSNPVPVALVAPYPSGASPLTASATGTTGATAATLSGTSGKTTFLCGFSIGSNATVGLGGTATISGVISGSMNFIQPIAVTPAVGQLDKAFSPCIPASGVNTGITVTSAAAGLGGATDVNAWGYQQ